MTRRRPTLRLERQLLSNGATTVAGMDEVGRGALAGPVSVGVVVVSPALRRAPVGIADSKVLTEAVREVLAPQITTWAHSWGVGHAGPEEIDAVGLVAALRLAGWRALRSLPCLPSVVILDGSHDWLTAPTQASLFDDDGGLESRAPVPVIMRVRADQDCTSVAAASIVAKVERDAIMRRAAEGLPEFDWASNKGYAAPAHREALARYGPTAFHRSSWNLPAAGA